jgi:gliding motility-associated-like protein
VQFVNLSTGATRYEWDFGKFGTSADKQPTLEISEMGIHAVRLVAYNTFGCSDTSKGTLTIYGDYAIWLPTAFTPGHDPINKVFQPVVSGVSSYVLEIYNRHGLLLYSGENQGWDGTYKGEPVPEGMYICNLKITKLNKDKVQEQGVVMVLKGE